MKRPRPRETWLGILRSMKMYLVPQRTSQNKEFRPQLSLPLQAELCWRSAEALKVEKFSGLLEYLTKTQENAICTMEDAINKYTFFFEECVIRNLPKEKQNFILAKIILYCNKNTSKIVKTIKKQKDQPREVLQ